MGPQAESSKSAQTEAPASQFLFIDQDIDRSTQRYQVRKHVAREFVRAKKERQIRAGRRVAEGLWKGKDKQNEVGRFVVDRWKPELKEKATFVPYRSPDQNRLDKRRKLSVKGGAEEEDIEDLASEELGSLSAVLSMPRYAAGKETRVELFRGSLTPMGMGMEVSHLIDPFETFPARFPERLNKEGQALIHTCEYRARFPFQRHPRSFEHDVRISLSTVHFSWSFSFTLNNMDCI